MEELQQYVGKKFKKICISFPGGMVIRRGTAIEVFDDISIFLADGTIIIAEKIRGAREKDEDLFISC